MRNGSTTSRGQSPWWVTLLAGFLVLAVIVFGFQFLRFALETSPEFSIAFIGAVSTALFGILQFRKIREREIESRQFELKKDVYIRLMKAIQKVFESQRVKEPLDNESFVRELVDIRTDMFVWASADCIKALNELYDPAKDNAPDQLMLRLASLYKEIRRDLGHSDPKDAELEIALSHLQPDAKQEIRETLEGRRK